MNFQHRPLFKEESLLVEQSQGMRFYKDQEDNRYPSVTTVINHYNEFVDVWRENVGHDKAHRVSYIAKEKGNRLHNLLDKYLKNESIDVSTLDPITKFNFQKAQLFLDNNIKEVHNVESLVYSEKLRVAGKLDLLCTLKNKGLTLVDFKTSFKEKRKDWIHNYFMQTSAYSFALSEKFAIDVDSTLVLIFIDDQQNLQCFFEKPSKFIKQFIEKRKEFREKAGV